MTDGLLPEIWKAIFGDSENKESSLNLSNAWNEVWNKVESPYFRDRMGAPLEIEAPTDDPYEQDYNRILSIQQKGSRGFRTIDIDPFVVTNEQYPTVLSSSTLGNLFGFENGYATLGFGVDTDVSPFYRTIELSANATFMRIDFLPPRINNNVNEVTNTALLGQSFGPEYDDPGTGQRFIANSYEGSTSISADILVQFDDVNSSPIIVKDGDTFEIPFNTVFVTFKQWTHRFRITFGYNTKLEKTDQKILATRPAFYNSNGLLNASKFHYVPFCITSGDLNGSYSNPVLVTEGVDREDTLIRNFNVFSFTNPTRENDRGSSYVWLRKLSISASTILPANSGGTATFGLYVFGYGSVGGSVGPRKRKRRIVELSKTFQFTSATDFNFNLETETDELIRIRLGWGDSIVLVSTFSDISIGTSLMSMQFNIDGYSVGFLLGTALSITKRPITPFDTPFRFVEEQYPLDYLNLGNPGSDDTP